ncbi:MAG TPA: hypothetical protein VIV57_07560 [Anaeromyxobacter sp.]
MRRLFCVALLAGAACSEVSRVEPGSTDTFYKPTGIGVYAGKLVVASSNADLLFDSATGGSVITVDPAVPRPDPTKVGLVGGLLIQSFAAQMAIADPNDPRGAEFQCDIPAPIALVPVRGADLLYRITLGPGGVPSCGDGCVIDLSGHAVADPYSVGVACGGGIARLYVGYLRSFAGVATITQIDLLKNGEMKSNVFGIGQMRSFAYDSAHKRLYAAQAGGIHWVDLSEDCDFEAADTSGGCHGGVMAIPSGLEAHAIALSRPRSEVPTPPRRLYVLARVFDAQAAAAVGIRFGDVDGYLLVMDLAEDLAGQAQVHLVKPPIRVGFGPIAMALLPGRAGKRDVVAALTVDDPALLLFDDDNDASVVIGRDIVSTPSHVATGHPWLGTQTFGLAVDPVATGGVARVYVGSFQESYVTPIDVPLDDIEGTAVPPAAGFARIMGGTP